MASASFHKCIAPTRWGSIWLGLFFVLCTARAQTIDTLTFGNDTSETAHALATGWDAVTPADVVTAGGGTTPSDPSATAPSETVTGGLGLSGRRLLPRTPNADLYGGNMTFTMTVDPAKQNYATLKFWGSDASTAIWLVLNCNGKEVGDRHGGSGAADGLYHDTASWFTGRFYYRTMPLPLALTTGQTSVTLTIRSMGWLSFYDSGAYFGHYAKLMSSVSPTVYTVFTHTGAYADISADTQGTAPAVSSPRTTETETTTLNSVKSAVNSKISSKLSAALSTLTPLDVDFLAQSYDAKQNQGQTWITSSTDSMLAQVIAAIDYMATQQSTSNYQSNFGNDSWGGGFGPLGDAIRLLWPQLNVSATMTGARISNWSQALRASIDAGRYNRLSIANQAISAATNTYNANRGLLLVDPANAIYENEAVRYLREAAGLDPWLGNDQVGTGPTPIRGLQPYGPNWYMGTTDGTTKDGDGFVGSDYGEVGPRVYRMGLIAGDAALQARGLLVTRSRCKFRYPFADTNGFRIQLGPEYIGERNNAMPGHTVYLGRGDSDDFFVAAQGAATVGGDLVGYFQQQINEGQLFRLISSLADPYLPMRYATIKALPQTGTTLPMSTGNPDFAWVDKENMAVAAKKGEERLYVNMYWRQPSAINGFAKVFQLLSNTMRVGDIQLDDLQFVSSGQSSLIPNSVDLLGNRVPPDNPVNAYAGTPVLSALRSDLTSVPSQNRDGGRGTGYTLRYGNWLVGINAHHANSYSIKLPAGFTSALDLVSNTTKTGPVILSPKSAVVFYLSDTADTNPTPSAPLYLTAVGGVAQVQLSWSSAAAATSYVLQRRTAGGSYATIASGLTGTSYTDTSGIVAGAIYYYQLFGVNSAGQGHASPEVKVAAGPPAPWANTDIGSVGIPGLTAFDTGVFTVAGSGGDIGGTADQFQFAYLPMTGDGTITARVAAISSISSLTKAGVMMREIVSGTSASGAKMAAALQDMQAIAPRFPTRYSQDGGMSWQNGSGAYPPVWVRLARAGNVFTASQSLDGKAWSLIGNPVTISGMASTIYAGLAVCSRSSTAASYISFDHVNAPGWTLLAAPATLSATRNDHDINLKWSPVSSATSYGVKRALTQGGPYSNVATGLTSSSYTDPDLAGSGIGLTYYYVVSAWNARGESVDSVEAFATIGDTPSAPLNLSTTSAAQILTWTPSIGANFYSIKQSSTSGGPYTLVGTTTDTSFNLGLAAGSGSYFIVTATNAIGEGSASLEFWWITTPATVTAFNPYTGLIGLAQTGSLNLTAAGGTYISDVTRSAGLIVNGGLGFSGNGAANLSVNGSAVGNTNDQFGPLSLNAGPLFAKITPNSATNSTMTFSSVARKPGTQLNFGHQVIGSAPLASATANTMNVVLITSPALIGSGGGVTQGVIPYAFTSASGTSINSVPTTYDNTYGLRALNTTSEMSNLTTTFTAGQNARVTSNRTLNSPITANSLWFGSSTTYTVSGSTTLNITSGVIGVAQGGILSVATLNFGGAEGQVNIANLRTLTISSAITGSGGLTVGLENLNSNGANLVLSGNNTYTGITTFSGNNPAMTVRLVSSLALQNSTLDYNGYGASFTFGNGTTTGKTAYTFGGLKGAQDIALINNNALPAAVALTVGGDGDSTTYSGILSGTGGSLTKIGTGTLTLSGANTYTGLTTIGNGTLGLAGSIAGGLTIGSGGKLLFDPGNARTVPLAGTFTLSAGASLSFGLGGNYDRIALGGSYLAPSGTVIVNLNALGGFGTGAYDLITGATGISASSFVIGAAPPGYSYFLSASGGTLTLVVYQNAIDLWRYQNFGTTNNTGIAADNADPDGDGMTNAQEFAAGTNPNNWSDVLRGQLAPASSGGGMVISFSAKAGHSYVMEYKDDLTLPGWQTLATYTPSADGTNQRTDSSATAHRFYRVRTPAQ